MLDHDILIGQHVAGRTFAAEDVRDPVFLPRLAAVLQKLHRPRDSSTVDALEFSVFQTIFTYAKTCARPRSRPHAGGY